MTDGEGEEAPLVRVKAFIQEYKLPLMLGGGSVVCLVLSLIFLFRSVYSSAPIEFKTANSAVEQSGSVSGAMTTRGVVVDVAGAVNTPGVYTLPIGSRVDDALTAAGGLTKNADTAYVTKILNRAAKVTDGGKIYVPRVGEDETSYNPEILSRRGSTSDNLSPLLQRTGTSQNGLVSINRASQSDLESLSGIGPATATKIIAGRPYQTLNEVVIKKAMSQSLYDKLKSQLTL
jgi:competence protein ComEA